MADGVNTGGFVPTQPAIVDTSAAFTRLLNVAQRQQERDTAMQLAEQQRLQRQMEAQLDVINGFDSSKMVADDRMMFNDAVNQLRMDFVEGKITDPMQFRGRVAKLRNYYGQFTQYAQDPETLAARDNMMKISYYPSELNKANEQLGAGVEYEASQDIYNERVNIFEHPLGGAEYSITPQGDILVGTPQGNIPVDSLPRQGAQLFVPGMNYTGEGTIDGIVSESTDVARAIQRNVPKGKYIPTAYEGVLMGSQSGRSGIVSSYEQEGNSFGGFEDLVEAFITEGRVGVSNLIQNTPDENRAASLQALADDLYANGESSFSYREWKRSVENRYGIVTPSKDTTELSRKKAALLRGGEYLQRTPFMNTMMPESSYTVGILGGESMPFEGAEKGKEEGEDVFFDVVVDPVDIVFFDDGRVGMKYTVKDGDGTINARYIDRSQRPRLSRYLEGEFGVTLDELESAYRGKFPETQPTATEPVAAEPQQQFVIPVFFPEDTVQQAVAQPEPEEQPLENRVVRTEADQRVEEARASARDIATQNLDQVKQDVMNMFRGKMLRTEFGQNMRAILQEERFLNALVQEGYVDPTGLIGDLNQEQKKQAVMNALEAMGDDQRAEYLKRMVML